MSNDNRRDVELRIRGVDQTGAASNSAAANVRKVTKALTDQEKAALAAAEASAELYSATSKQLKDAQDKAVSARKAYDDYANSLGKGVEPTRKQTREFESLGKAAERADKDVDRLTARLGKAETKFNATFGAFEKATGDRASRSASERGSLQLADAIEKALADQEKIAQLSAFRLVGAQAAASASSVERWSAESAEAASNSSKFASGLMAIIDPARNARSTLDGLEEEVKQLSTFIGNADRPIRDYQDAINDLGRAQGELVRQGAMIDNYRNQEAAVNRASAAFEAYRLDVLRAAEAVATSDEPNEELARALAQVEGNMTLAGRALDQERGKLVALKRPLDAAKISTDQLAQAEMRLKTAAEQTAVAVGKLDKAQAGQNTRTGRFLGLKPYELQNLGYQLNDVFTQISSGTSVTQTFAQQGGQIFQLFPRLFGQIATKIPIIAAAAALLIPVIATFKNLFDLAASAREFNAALTVSADGAAYNAKALAETAHNLDVYGGSLENAKVAIKSFLAQGIAAEQLEAFGIAAENTSIALGVEMVDAAKSMATAFTGGYEEVRKLDESLNFLSVTERQHIKDLFDQGKAAEARTEAFRIYARVMDEGAAQALGPWAQAGRSLTTVWDSFLTLLGNLGPVKEMIRWLGLLANAAKDAAANIPGAKGKPGFNPLLERQRARLADLREEESTAIARRGFSGDRVPFAGTEPRAQTGANITRRARSLSEVQADIKKMQGTITATEKAVTDVVSAASAQSTKAGEDYMSNLREQAAATKEVSAAEKIRLAGLKAQREAQSAGATKAQVAEAKALAEQIARTNLAAAQGRKDSAAARREDSKARADENRRNALEQQLANDMRAMEGKIAKQQQTDLTSRLAAVDTAYEKLFDTLAKFKASGGTSINGMSLADFEAQINANKTILKQQEQQDYYADSIKSLEQQRAAELKKIADEYARGEISGAEALRRAQEIQTRISPEIAKMADDAVLFAEALAGANPTPELKAFIEQMKQLRAAANNTKANNTPSAQLGQSVGAAEERELNEIISQRNDLVETYNQLVTVGVLTEAQAAEKTRDAYMQAQPLIAAQIAQMKELKDLQLATGQITQQAYDAWIAKMQLLSTQAVYVDANFTKIKDTIVQLFSQGIVEGINTVVEAIGKAVDGTGEWEDVLDALGAAALNFIASFLKGIADLIIQMLVLKAIKSLPFLDGLSKGVGDFSGLIAGSATLSIASKQLGTASNVLAGSALPWFLVAKQLKEAAQELAAAAAVQTAANFTAAIAHDGAVIGSAGGGRSRSLSPSLFANAPRYHSGTPAVGLGPRERAAVLEIGEEVLTRDDPRHVLNGGKNQGAAAARPIFKTKTINLFDPVEMLRLALADSEGEKVFLNWVQENSNVFKGTVS